MVTNDGSKDHRIASWKVTRASSGLPYPAPSLFSATMYFYTSFVVVVCENFHVFTMLVVCCLQQAYIQGAFFKRI